MQTPAAPSDDTRGTAVRTWLSPRPSEPGERAAYAAVGAILIMVFLGGLALALLSWLAGDLLFGLFGAVVGLLALALGYRMIFAAATGRRLYWWSGQREHDERGTP